MPIELPEIQLTPEGRTILYEVDRSEGGQFRIDGNVRPGPGAVKISFERVRQLEELGLVRRRLVSGWRSHDFWCLTDAGHALARTLEG